MALHAELGHLTEEELVPGGVVRQHRQQLAVRLRALVTQAGPEEGGLQGLQRAGLQMVEQALHLRAAVGTGSLQMNCQRD